MTPEERLEAVIQSLELLQLSQQDTDRKFQEVARRFAAINDVLERIGAATELLMYGMENHEQRIGALEGR